MSSVHDNDNELDPACLPFSCDETAPTAAAAATLSWADACEDGARTPPLQELDDAFHRHDKDSAPSMMTAASINATYGQLLSCIQPTPAPYPYPAASADPPRRDWFGGSSSTASSAFGHSKKKWTAVIFMRERKLGACTWFEFLLEFRNGAYQFLQADASRTRPADAASFLMDTAARRGMLFAPTRAADIERCFQTEIIQDATCHKVYLIPFAATQRPRAERELGNPPAMMWAVESELAVHVQLGLPAVFGRPVCTRSLAALAALPVRFRFASSTPPLVLYAGFTSQRDAKRAAASGLTLKEHAASGRCGNAIYASKWAAAAAIAGTDGSVLRVLIAARTCVSLTASHLCSCGTCGHAPFTDHKAVHRAGADMMFIPDTSHAAAEWAVFDPFVLNVECVQHMADVHARFKRGS